MQFTTESAFITAARKQGYTITRGEWVDGEAAVEAVLPEKPWRQGGFFAASIGGELRHIQGLRDYLAAMDDPRG